MKPRLSLPAVTVVTTFGLAACAGTGDLQKLQQTEATGSPFSKALTEEYRTFATREADVEKDWLDQRYFARKGLETAAGAEPLPEDVRQWGIEESEIAEMESARARLIAALDAGGRANHPTEAATAQARFDCWVEQQEEAWQADDIAACKAGFETALAALNDTMAQAATPPKPEPKPETPLQTAAVPKSTPQAFRIQFDFDSATLDATALENIAAAVAAIEDSDATRVTVVGYADRSGEASYNETLSKARADAVADRLREQNVAGTVSVRYMGEANPEVPTDDGVKEPRNRRVTIEVR